MPRYRRPVRLIVVLGALVLAQLGQVQPVSAATQAVGQIDLGRSPRAIDIDQGRGRLYVQTFSEVSVIDIETSSKIGKLDISSPREVAYDAAGDRIFASTFDGWLHSFDGATWAREAGVNVGGDPVEITVDPLTGKAYVADRTGGRVVVIDGGVVTATIGVGMNPLYMALDASLRRLYVPNVVSGSVSVIDVETDSVVATLPFPGARGVAVDEATHRVFLPNWDTGWVSVYDGATLSELSRIWLREQPGCCAGSSAWDPVRQRLYLHAGASEIDMSTQIASFSFMNPPPTGQVVADIDTGLLYVADEGADAVTIVESDATAPMVRVTPEAIGGSASTFLESWWTNGTWRATLECFAACQGVEYRADDGEPQTYVAPIEFSAAGRHVIEYRVAGSADPYRSVALTIDRDAPRDDVALTNDGQASGMWGSNSWLLRFACADPFDGDWPPTCFPVTNYNGGPDRWDASPLAYREGIHSIRTRVIDAAGNESAPTTRTLGIDRTVPVATVDVEPIYANEGSSSPSGWRITLACNDPLAGANPGASGCAGIEYRINDGSWQTYQEPVVIDGGGHHIFRYQMFDAVGNTAADQLTVDIEGAPPETEMAAETPGSDHEGATNDSWTIALSCTDPHDGASGCASTLFRVVSDEEPDNEFEDYERPFTIDEDGSYVLEYYSIDRVGNTEPTHQTSLRVDTVRPDGTLLTPSGLILPSVVPARFLARGADQPAPNGFTSGIWSACFEVQRIGSDEPVGCFDGARLPRDMWGATVPLEQGSYSVAWVMRDHALNEFRSSPITITVV